MCTRYDSVLDIADPEGESAAVLDSIVSHLRQGEGSSHMVSDFDFDAIAGNATAPVVAEVVRSFYYFGLPLAGCVRGQSTDTNKLNTHTPALGTAAMCLSIQH